MKKKLLLLTLLVLMIFSGCTLLPWVKDPNNIYDWFKMPLEDALYYYRHTTYISTINLTTTDTYQSRIMDVKENSDNIVVTVNDDGATRYLVADKKENLIFYGKDQFFDGYSNEEVYLEAPVEINNVWFVDSEERKIVSIDTTVEVNSGKFSDVVKVRIYDSDYLGYYYWSISRGLVYYYKEFGNGSYFKIELLDINE